MAGYTRQDTANNIANGNVIDADDFDAEYNAIESAFNSTSGHTHDGTSGGGAPITKVGPAQDLIVSGTAVLPKTTNTLDLGSGSVQYKDAFFDGLLNTDTLSVDENATVSGTLGVTGNTTLGGTLNVTGATLLNSTLGVNGEANLGTLNVVGAAGINGNFDINFNKFTVNATSGNTTVAGTLGVTGATTVGGTLGVTGATTVGGTLGVTGQITGNLTGAVTGNADTATAWKTPRTLSLTGDVTGSVSGVDGTGNISITTTIQPNSVALGTDTTGNYVASLSAGTGVSIANNTGEGVTPTISIGQAVATTSNVTFNNVTANGNLTVAGSLTVSGTTTTVNTETVNIADNLIVLNSNYTGSTPTENGGIEIERGTQPSKSLVWDEANDRWTVGSESFVASTFIGALSGNASTATKAAELTTARTISLSGNVTGSASFNGGSNITITTTVANDSHTHDGRYYTESEADARFLKVASGGQISGNVKFGDNVVCSFGALVDAELYFNGTTLYLDMNSDKDFIIRDGNSSNATRFTFDTSAGNFTATGEVTAYSDERLKSDIVTIPNALDKVKALRGVNFTKDGKASTGVIAQEVQKVIPEVVHEGDEYLSVAYGNLVGVLIEAVKELSAEVEALKAK